MIVRLFLSFSVLLAVPSTVTWAAPVPEPVQGAALRETLDALPQQMQHSLADVRTAIMAASTDEGWPAAIRAECLEWLDKHTPQLPVPANFRGVSGTSTPPFPYGSKAERHWAHLRALTDFRRSLIVAYSTGTMAYVENAWLMAQQPEDLTAARSAIGALRAHTRDTGLWHSLHLATLSEDPIVTQWRANRPLPLWGAPQESPIAEAVGAATLLPAAPFYIPGRGRTLEEWARAWATARMLEQVHLEFLERPRIAQRMAEFDDAGRLLLRRLFAEIERDILSDLPREKYQAAFEQFRGFVLPMVSPVPTDSFRGFDMSGDYQLLLARISADRPPPRTPADAVQPTSAWQQQYQEIGRTWGAYDALSKWRAAQRAGDQAGQAKAEKELDAAGIDHLPPSLRNLYAQWRTPAPAPVSPRADVTLASALEEFSQRPENQQVRRVTVQLLAIWKSLAAGMTAPPDESASSDMAWETLAEQPGSLAIFALRDREARQTLWKITGGTLPENDQTLADLFEQSLEKSILRGDLKRAGQILVLAQATAALPEETLSAYRTNLQIFLNPGETPRMALVNYERILTETVSPACATLAAHRLRLAIPRP